MATINIYTSNAGTQTLLQTINNVALDPAGTVNLTFPVTTASSGGSGLAAPTGLTASASYNLVRVTWNAVSGATGYSVQYKTDAATTWQTVTVTGTSATLTGLTPNTIYNVKVAANSSSGAGTYSTVVNQTTLPKPLFELRFEGNFNDSSNANNGTAVGTAAIASDSVRGNVLTLNNATTPSSVGINVGTPQTYTKAVWVFVTTEGSGFPNFFSSNATVTGGAANYLGAATINNNPFVLNAAHSTDGTTVYETTRFPLNQWVHIAVSYNNSTKAFSLYRNGAKVATATGVNSFPGTPNKVNIGIVNPTENNAGLTGKADNAMLWDTVLSDTQVLALYNAQK